MPLDNDRRENDLRIFSDNGTFATIHRHKRSSCSAGRVELSIVDSGLLTVK